MIEETLAGVRGDDTAVLAVILAGLDGMVVASCGDDESVGTEAVAAAFADLYRKVGAAHRDAGLPVPSEVTAGGRERRIVVRAVTPEYLLLAVLGEAGIMGRTRFALSRAAERLEPELS